MALSKDQLKKDLLAMMDKGSDPTWTKEKSAEALAAAVDAFVRSGVVTGIKVKAEGQPPGIPPGTVFTQTNEVHLH